MKANALMSIKQLAELLGCKHGYHSSGGPKWSILLIHSGKVRPTALTGRKSVERWRNGRNRGCLDVAARLARRAATAGRAQRNRPRLVKRGRNF